MKLDKLHTFAAVFCIMALGGCGNSDKRAKRAVSDGDHALERGEIVQALADYSSATRLNPLNGAAYLGLARAEIRSGHPERAEPALTRALDTLRDWPSIRECYIDLSDIYIARHGGSQSYLDAAGGMASSLLARDPKSFDGHRIWAEVSRLRADLATSDNEAMEWRRKAIHEFSYVHQINPDDAAILSSWAAVLEADHDPEGARSLYLKALKLEPGNVWIISALYKLALEKGDDSQARIYVQQSLGASGSHEDALIQMAREAILAGRMEDAREILYSLTENTRDPDVLAGLLIRAGYPEQAFEVLKKGAGRYPSRAAHYLEEIAERQVSLKKNSLAATSAAECLSKFPSDIRCRAVKIFENYQSSARPAEIQALERLAAENPGYPEMRLYLGRMYQAAGRLHDARFQFDLGLTADQDDADLRLASAELELISDTPEAARADARNVLSRDPRNRLALDILDRTAPSHQP